MKVAAAVKSLSRATTDLRFCVGLVRVVFLANALLALALEEVFRPDTQQTAPHTHTSPMSMPRTQRPTQGRHTIPTSPILTTTLHTPGRRQWGRALISKCGAESEIIQPEVFTPCSLAAVKNVTLKI